MKKRAYTIESVPEGYRVTFADKDFPTKVVRTRLELVNLVLAVKKVKAESERAIR